MIAISYLKGNCQVNWTNMFNENIYFFLVLKSRVISREIKWKGFKGICKLLKFWTTSHGSHFGVQYTSDCHQEVILQLFAKMTIWRVIGYYFFRFCRWVASGRKFVACCLSGYIGRFWGLSELVDLDTVIRHVGEV